MKNEPSSSHSTDSHFEYLLKAAGRIQSRPSEWVLFEKQHHPDEAMPGDIWITKRPGEDSAESWVIILSATKLNGTSILKAAPIFHDTTFANDEDVILPAALLGFEAGVAFGCTVTTVPSALSRLVTHATGEWFRQLQQFDSFLNGSAERPQKLESGIPYLDSLDSRRDFHAELLQNLNHVQGALADEIDMEMTETEEVPDISPVEIPFYASWLEDLSLGVAADDEMRYTARYNVKGMEEILQCFAFQRDDQIHFRVWNNQGNPSLNLDGYSLQSANGGTPVIIQKGEARLPLGASQGSFLLKNRDGDPVRLILAAD